MSTTARHLGSCPPASGEHARGGPRPSAAALQTKGTHPTPVRLTEVGIGRRARLVAVELHENAADMLIAMGLRDGCGVTLCRRGEPCVVEVCSGPGGKCRIGMSRATASGIFVDGGADRGS